VKTHLLLSLVTLLATACGGSTSAGASETLTLTGSSTVAPLAAELGVRFESTHPNLRVDVQSGGSSRGIADARAGHADLGMSSRALKDSEGDLVATTIAHDGVGLIAHASQSLDGLTSDQVRAIFTGEITDWSELGGTPGPITVVNKAEGRATLEVFLEHFGLEARQIHADVVAGENEQAIKTVVGTPGAVGYVSIGTAEVDIAAGVAIKLLALDGVPASSTEVTAGRYPMARPLNLVTSGVPSLRALEFIEFARAPANADLVRREAFVPVAAE